MSSVAETSTSAGRRRVPLTFGGRRPLAGGVVWIVLIGVLLAGVVAVNVLVLQLNIGLDRLGGERAQLEADIARLESKLSSTAAAARIEHQGRDRLGLVPADPATTTYVTLDPPAR